MLQAEAGKASEQVGGWGSKEGDGMGWREQERQQLSKRSLWWWAEAGEGSGLGLSEWDGAAAWVSKWGRVGAWAALAAVGGQPGIEIICMTQCFISLQRDQKTDPKGGAKADKDQMLKGDHCVTRDGFYSHPQYCPFGFANTVIILVCAQKVEQQIQS